MGEEEAIFDRVVRESHFSRSDFIAEPNKVHGVAMQPSGK